MPIEDKINFVDFFQAAVLLKNHVVITGALIKDKDNR